MNADTLKPFTPPFTYEGNGCIRDSAGQTILTLYGRVLAKKKGFNPDEMQDRIGAALTLLMNAYAPHPGPPLVAKPYWTTIPVDDAGFCGLALRQINPPA